MVTRTSINSIVRMTGGSMRLRCERSVDRDRRSSGRLVADEERALEPPCLPGREAPILDQLDDLIRELPLLLRKGRRIRVGVQTGANIRVDSRRVRELVGELMQLAHLLEQRLELRIVDGHDRWNGSRGPVSPDIPSLLETCVVRIGGDRRIALGRGGFRAQEGGVAAALPPPRRPLGANHARS